jgi:hypothetical protein
MLQRNEETLFSVKKHPPIYYGGLERSPVIRSRVCPAFGSWAEARTPRDEKREREVAKATAERTDLPAG